jgi:hypothetical protein
MNDFFEDLKDGLEEILIGMEANPICHGCGKSFEQGEIKFAIHLPADLGWASICEECQKIERKRNI